MSYLQCNIFRLFLPDKRIHNPRKCWYKSLPQNSCENQERTRPDLCKNLTCKTVYFSYLIKITCFADEHQLCVTRVSCPCVLTIEWIPQTHAFLIVPGIAIVTPEVQILSWPVNPNKLVATIDAIRREAVLLTTIAHIISFRKIQTNPKMKNVCTSSPTTQLAI